MSQLRFVQFPTVQYPIVAFQSRTISRSLNSITGQFRPMALPNTAMGFNDFGKDIYTIWRISEANRGLSPYFINIQKLGITENLRQTVISNILFWKDNLNVSSETIHLGIYIFDKCLDSCQINCNLIKDIAAVSLVLASKLEDYEPLKFSNVISVGITETTDVKFMNLLEKQILYNLNYTLAYPTSLIFMNYFHHCIKTSCIVVHMSHFMLELTLLSTKYRDFGGAFTAHAAVCLSCGIVSSIAFGYFSISVVEEAEIDLFEASGIVAGNTRIIMRHIINDIIEARICQNDIWKEYSKEERYKVSTFVIPENIIGALQPQL